MCFFFVFSIRFSPRLLNSFNGGLIVIHDQMTTHGLDIAASHAPQRKEAWSPIGEVVGRCSSGNLARGYISGVIFPVFMAVLFIVAYMFVESFPNSDGKSLISPSPPFPLILSCGMLRFFGAFLSVAFLGNHA